MYFFKDRFKNTSNADATIGLDIGSSMIKWVSLGCNNELKQYAIQAFSTPIGTACTKNASQIADCLKKTLLEQDYIRNCIVNMPDILICSKWVQIDSTDCQPIEEVIELLAKQSIPYPLNKLYFDYQIFDPSPDSREKCKVLIVACHREHLDFRLDIIQQANLIPLVVEVSSYALERAYSFFYPDANENTILLDIETNQLTLLFLNNSQTIVYCENLISKLDQESILLQIKRCIKSYALAYPYFFVKQLFIIGSNNSLLSYLMHKLDGFLDLKIQTLKHQNQIKYREELNSKEIKKEFLNLFLSYGLALRINLSNKERKLNYQVR
jgi:Tfp pilus assembly PilM family ATPase